jgi:diguanylate cyclase (GGDEF)-like protein/PAS domain S-box-containing protein
MPTRRSRAPFLLVLGFVAWLGTLLVVVNHVLLGSFERLEQRDALTDIDQVRHAFEADLHQLAVSTRDYGEWDDAFEFVQGRRPGFVEANLGPVVLDGMQVDVVLFTDRDGHEVYSLARTPAHPTIVSPAPRALLDELAPQVAGAIEAARTGVHPSGPNAGYRIPNAWLAATAYGTVGFSFVDVVPTRLDAPAAGRLLFVRFIEADELARVRETSQRAVEFLPLAGAGRAPPGLREQLAGGPRAVGSRWATPRDDVSVEAGTVLGDARGQPVAVLTTALGREVYGTGRRTMTALSALLLVASAILTAAVIVLLVRLRRQLAERLLEERRYHAIVDQLDEGVLFADDATGRIVDANPAVRRWLGLEPAVLKTRRLADVLSSTPRALEALATSRSPRCVLEDRLFPADGAPLEVEARFLYVQQGERRLICCVLRDLTSRKRLDDLQRATRRRLAHLARHDVLTGLPNRLHLQTALPRILANATDRGLQAALLYVDLDHFKQSNDTRGHGFGDHVLQIVARRLRGAVGQEDLVVRMGGDEFVVVTTDEVRPGPGAIDAVADRLLGRMRQPLEVDGSLVHVTASIGVARWPEHAVEPDDLLKHADIALYQAKSQGRDRAVTFSTEMNVDIADRIALQQALRNALDSDELYAEYQPIVELSTRKLLRFEALARWRHPERGPIPPDRFIAIAEETGMIPVLGERILEIVCRQLRAWADQGVRLVPVAVNVSPLQLEREPFDQVVLRTAQRHGVPPRLLAFEITETSLLRNPERQLETLKRLRALGCTVSIDDFGTGYSSLAYLKHLSIDYVKIDRAFVRDLAADHGDTAIVRAVVMMAEGLGVGTIAEGVETEEQRSRLRAAGCQAGQGWLFGKPLPARHCRALLDELTQQLRLTETVIARSAGRM